MIINDAGTDARSEFQIQSEYWGSALAYAPAVARMEQAQIDRKAGLIPDSAFYLEHEAVITFGRATPDEHRVTGNPSIPTVEVPRGGLATYHGPGQLVGYLVVDLSQRGDGRPADLHAYLRAIEDGLIAFLQAEYGLPAGLRESFTGVWTHGFPGSAGVPPALTPAEKTTSSLQPTAPPATHQGESSASLFQSIAPAGGMRAGHPRSQGMRKLASIGVSCRRWVTAHGFALNIEPDMNAFGSIVPCGITDAEMTSVRRECELAGVPFHAKPMKELAAHVHLHLAQSLAQAGWCRAQIQEA